MIAQIDRSSANPLISFPRFSLGQLLRPLPEADKWAWMSERGMCVNSTVILDSHLTVHSPSLIQRWVLMPRVVKYDTTVQVLLREIADPALHKDTADSCTLM